MPTTPPPIVASPQRWGSLAITGALLLLATAPAAVADARPGDVKPAMQPATLYSGGPILTMVGSKPA